MNVFSAVFVPAHLASSAVNVPCEYEEAAASREFVHQQQELYPGYNSTYNYYDHPEAIIQNHSPDYPYSPTGDATYNSDVCGNLITLAHASQMSTFDIINWLSEAEIARFMTKHMVERQMLRTFGYPVESETQEGCIEVFKSAPCYFKPRQNQLDKAVNSRSQQCGIEDQKCERCKKHFKVTTAGEYVTKEMCSFHWGKKEARTYCDPNGIPVTVTHFSCCNRLASDPCTQNHGHVWNNMSVGLNGPYTDFATTLPKRRFVSGKNAVESNKIFALDCEMSYTGLGTELTKVSVIDYSGQLVYESIVHPRSQVVDYNTRFSGVSAKDYEPGKVVRTLSQVQTDLINLIDADDILVGHALENDLWYLRLVHSCIVDTSIMFPHPSGFPFKRGLKSLVSEYLGRDIQTDSAGHSSCEDSQASLELVLFKVCGDWMASSDF